MTLQYGAEHETFQAFLENHYQLLKDIDALKKVRTKAWELFTGMGLPSKKMEVYRTVHLRHLFSQSFIPSELTDVALTSIQPYIYPECHASVLVFINGHYNVALSNTKGLPERLNILTLEEASVSYSAFLNNQWAKLKEETDPFALINTALHRKGLFIYAPPKTIIESPIQILNIIDSKDQAMLIMPRVQAFVGAHSELKFISTHAFLSGSNSCNNQTVDFTIEENAKVHFNQINWNQSPNVWNFETLRATLKRNSTLNTLNITNGSNLSRQDYRVTLAGEYSEVQLNGVWMLKDKREAHVNVLIEHQAPNCRSNQQFNGVVTDFSRSSFEGKIFVQPEAQKTEAFQMNKNLILSDKAQADSKPNLEIFADDVKASHGSTFGQLDPDHLFYLKTRGINDEKAKNLLVYGFCQEVIDKLNVSSVHHQLSRKAQHYLQ